MSESDDRRSRCDDSLLPGVRNPRIGMAAGGEAQVDEEQQLRSRLDGLRVEHRDLDAAIEALAGAGMPDQLQLARLKKRKLRLRDEIASVEDRLIPDIIA